MKPSETQVVSGFLLSEPLDTMYYSHADKAEPGFSKEVVLELTVAAKVMMCKEWEKLVVIPLDEMYIKEDLVYNKHSGTLIGFTNLGEVN